MTAVAFTPRGMKVNVPFIFSFTKYTSGRLNRMCLPENSDIVLGTRGLLGKRKKNQRKEHSAASDYRVTNAPHKTR